MADTKERILEGSFSLFLQKNFKEVTMQEIVEKTGMSKGAFYHYFESKEQLFLEVIDHFISDLTINYSKLNKESLSQFYHNYITCMKDTVLSFLKKRNDLDSGFLNYYFLVFDAMKLFPSFREGILEHLKYERKAWTEMVGIARNKGEINSPLTDEQIANLFIYLSDGVGMHNILTGSIEDTANNMLIAWDNLYQGLKA